MISTRGLIQRQPMKLTSVSKTSVAERRVLLNHFILVLFHQCAHLCYTQPLSPPQLLCSD